MDSSREKGCIGRGCALAAPPPLNPLAVGSDEVLEVFAIDETRPVVVVVGLNKGSTPFDGRLESAVVVKFLSKA